MNFSLIIDQNCISSSDSSDYNDEYINHLIKVPKIHFSIDEINNGIDLVFSDSDDEISIGINAIYKNTMKFFGDAKEMFNKRVIQRFFSLLESDLHKENCFLLICRLFDIEEFQVSSKNLSVFVAFISSYPLYVLKGVISYSQHSKTNRDSVIGTNIFDIFLNQVEFPPGIFVEWLNLFVILFVFPLEDNDIFDRVIKKVFLYLRYDQYIYDAQIILIFAECLVWSSSVYLYVNSLISNCQDYFYSGNTILIVNTIKFLNNLVKRIEDLPYLQTVIDFILNPISSDQIVFESLLYIESCISSHPNEIESTLLYLFNGTYDVIESRSISINIKVIDILSSAICNCSPQSVSPLINEELLKYVFNYIDIESFNQTMHRFLKSLAYILSLTQTSNDHVKILAAIQESQILEGIPDEFFEEIEQFIL